MFERWRDLWDLGKLARTVIRQRDQIEALDQLAAELQAELDKAVEVAKSACDRQFDLAQKLATEQSAHRLTQVRLDEAWAGLESARSALEAKEEQRKWEVGRELDKRRLVERELADLKGQLERLKGVSQALISCWHDMASGDLMPGAIGSLKQVLADLK